MLFFHIISANGSADLRSPEKEVYFRSCNFIEQVAPLKYTKTCINIILYNFKNTIVSALNSNILKTNLSKIAYKEVKILCFSKLFSKNGICATVRFFCVWLFPQPKFNLFPRCFKPRKPIEIHLQNLDRLPL